MKAEDLFRCPKLAATITRQECFDRQVRGRKALKEGAQTTPLNDYCALRRCGLGAFHTKMFRTKVLLYVERKPLVRKVKRGFLLKKRS
jgi:hypothetical protein